MGMVPDQYEEMATFASLRQPAWHGLGEVFSNEVSTKEMLELSNLANWNVRLEEISVPEDYYTDKPQYLVVRDHPAYFQPHVMGTVGERYNVFQNEELFEFGDALLDGGRWETAGGMKEGRIVFASLALERETVLDPTGVADVVKNYLILSTSHDGSRPLVAAVTPVRVVCQNTLDIALKSATQSFKIRHTQSMKGKAAIAREALIKADTYIDEFDKMASAMIEKEITSQQFFDIVNAVYPKPDDEKKAANTRWDNKIDQIESIWRSDTTDEIGNTAWGAYNALTERLDWHRTIRGGNTESRLAAASGFDPLTKAEKGRMLKIVNKIAGVSVPA